MVRRSSGSSGSVTYRPVDNRYMARRRLRRYAGFWSLWALGVGAVISGDFFGWNFGLEVGGFGGLAVAAAIAALMYLCLCFSISEMAPAMPHTGGAYSFARTALGPWAGFITGLAEVIAYVLTPAVIVVGIGGYVGAAVNSILGFLVPAPAWWLAFYAIFVGINLSGVAATFRVVMGLTLLALVMLALFWLDWGLRFDLDLARNVLPAGANPDWLSTGWMGIAHALPFAIWFFLAIEMLPLATEESRRPAADLPRALSWGILTLIGTAAVTLLLSAGLPSGWATSTLLGFAVHPAAPSLMVVAGLAVSFHALIYAYSRRIYSLSRSGYLPRWLSLTSRRNNVPHLALLTGAIIGFAVSLLIEYGQQWFGANAPVAAVLLNMAVFGALISYVMQMLSFVRLRQRFPGLHRPYRSPLGSVGAAVAGLVASSALVLLFIDGNYRLGIYGCALFGGVALLYFALFSRRRLVSSPEESFARFLEEE